MERWLLISNCQTTGLANSFNLLNKNFEVTPMDIWQYRALSKKNDIDLKSYFRVVVSPELVSAGQVDISEAGHVTFVPSAHFSAYHPDVTYIFDGKSSVKGVMDDYHSIIVLAAYNAGLSVSDAVLSFNGGIFSKLGYFDYWIPQRDRFIALYKSAGLDVSGSFAKWSRGASFMHSMNHPKINVIYDLAKLIMLSLGVPVQQGDFRPHDNLINGACWPVYPEIGETLGVQGGYGFKLFNQFRIISLHEFVAGSYDVYERYPKGALHVSADNQPVYDRFLSLVS